MPHAADEGTDRQTLDSRHNAYLLHIELTNRMSAQIPCKVGKQLLCSAKEVTLKTV